MTIDEKIEAKKKEIIERFDNLPLPIIGEAEFIESTNPDDFKLPYIPQLDITKIKGNSYYHMGVTTITYIIYLDGSGAYLKIALPSIENKDCVIDMNSNTIKVKFYLHQNLGYNDSYIKSEFKNWAERTMKTIKSYNEKVTDFNASIESIIVKTYRSGIDKASYFKKNFNPF